MQYYNSEQITILQEIRNSISLKKQNEPTYLSKVEFALWQTEHKDYFLHRGFLSIWDGIDVPEDAHEIVIEKRTSREGVKPYLVFENPECFREYFSNAHLLGIEVYSLFEDRFFNTIKSIANTYSVPLSAFDELQNEVEKCVGLNYSLEDVNITDEQLYGSLYNYLRKTIPPKATTVFSGYGAVVNIDISDWEETLNSSESSVDVLVTYIDEELEKLDISSVLEKILLMLRMPSDKNSKNDIKDNYLRQIIYSDRATGEFILYHYSSLKNRKSIWRPIAFSYQVQYSHSHGDKYLKYPVYVQKCGSITIGEMISSQIESYSSSNKKALSSMASLAEQAKKEDLYQKPLAECAENTEQIGKALSKELRTEEAITALARALLVAGLEKEHMTSFYETKGDEYHE